MSKNISLTTLRITISFCLMIIIFFSRFSIYHLQTTTMMKHCLHFAFQTCKFLLSYAWFVFCLICIFVNNIYYISVASWIFFFFFDHAKEFMLSFNYFMGIKPWSWLPMRSSLCYAYYTHYIYLSFDIMEMLVSISGLTTLGDWFGTWVSCLILKTRTAHEADNMEIVPHGFYTCGLGASIFQS